MRTFFHFSVRLRYLVVLFTIFALALVTVRHAADTGDFLMPEDRTNGQNTIAVFAPVTKSAEATVVELLSGEKVVAIGTVVSPLGYIVTKGSEISESPIVRLPNGRTLNARIIASDQRLDLALLTIPGVRLPAVRWGRSHGLRIGDWVVSPGQERRSWVGVVSAKRRAIKRVGGALGVSLGNRGGRLSGVPIIAVVEGSPAEAAGLAAGDEVLMVGERTVTTNTELISTIQEYDPGDEVTLQVIRKRDPMSFKVTLGFYSMFDQWNRNQLMSGETSDRRNGFPEVIQHAIPLTPNSMGSPLLNLRGETIGINIARADRVTSYAIPAERVQESIRAMIRDLRKRTSAVQVGRAEVEGR
jgi:serine protease Do